MNRQAASMSDGLANLGIGLLIAAAGIAAILRVAGTVAAFLTGTPQPQAGITAGLTVLLNPADPAAALEADGLNSIAYWRSEERRVGKERRGGCATATQHR